MLVSSIPKFINGKKYALDDIKEGSTIFFDGTPSGKVCGIMRKVTLSGTDTIADIRLHISHGDCGLESFHTYRHDGRSCDCASHDIIAIFNEE